MQERKATQKNRGAQLKEALSQAIEQYKKGLDLEPYKEQGPYRVSYPSSRTNPDLTPSEGIILDCLRNATAQEDDGWTNIDNATIRYRVGASSKVVVSRALRSLADKGLLKIEREGKQRWLSPKPPVEPIKSLPILIPWFILRLPNTTAQEKIILAVHLLPGIGDKPLAYIAKVLGCGKSWLCTTRRKFIEKKYIQEPCLSTGFRYQTNPEMIMRCVNETKTVCPGDVNKTKTGTLTKPKPYNSISIIDRTGNRMVFNRNLDSAPREQNDDREDKKKKSPVKRPGADDLKKRKYKHRGGPPRKNALVEYWNSLPYGRKHRPTSRAYKMAAQFFRAMLKGQLFPGAVDEAFAHDCRISDELIYKQWTAAEIKQVLEKMNRLFHPAYDSSRLPKDLNNLLLHEEYGTSRFLMVAQHGLPNRRKPGKKITKLVELTNDIAKAIVDNGGLMSNSLMGRLNYNLIQLNKHYEKNVLPGTPDWARHIISPYSRFLNEYLKFIGRTYNKDVIINPGWFKPDCIPYRRFLKWIDHESGANTNLSGTRGRWE